MSKLKFTVNNIGGDVVKQNDTYTVRDNKFLNKLVVSSTDLSPGKSTHGHRHQGQEEVYLFVEGRGRMEIDDEIIQVQSGDLVLIPDGAFHRVHNPTDKSLYFVCVFDGKRMH